MALGAVLGRLALARGLHALIDRLAVLLRQVGAADTGVHHVDAVARRLVVDQIADARHQFGALVAHHLDEGRFAEHAAQRRIEQNIELRVGGDFRTERLEEAQRILDAIAREGVDHQPLLVGGDHFLRRRFQVEDALVDIDHAVDERHLDVQARLVDHAHHFTQPHHQRLLGLIDGEQRAVEHDQRGEDEDGDDAADEIEFHRWPPVGVWPRAAARRRVH